MIALLLIGCAAPVSETPEDATPEDAAPEGAAPGVRDPPAPLEPVDVLVIGAGPAGMAAGIAAWEAGATVRILEREEHLGGATVYAGGLMMFSGTDVQAESGVVDSPELLLSEWHAMTGGDPDDPWVQRFAEENLNIYDWLETLGVSWVLISQPGPEESVPRYHMVSGGGAALVGALERELPADAVSSQTEAISLVNGAERGAWLVDDAGQERWIEAGAVVVATGGFLRNLELVAQARPDLDTDAVWFSTGPDADGNGHTMLEEVGGVWRNAAAIGLYAHGVPDTRTPGEELLFERLVDGIWVNTDGERFVDESDLTHYGPGDAVVAQPEQEAFAVFDQGSWPGLELKDPLLLPDETEPFPDLDALIDAGYAAQADDIEALAAALGVDADGLLATVAAHNAAAEAGEDDAWQGRLRAPLVSPPYIAVRVVPVLAKAFGGMDVDEQGMVTEGIYAAGELTGMAGGSLVEDVGFTGSLSAVILSGQIAGEAAASYSLQ